MMQFDIDHHTLKVVTYEVPSGKKLDSFTITKKVVGPDPCVTPAVDAGTSDVGVPDLRAVDSGATDTSVVADSHTQPTDTGQPVDAKTLVDVAPQHADSQAPEGSDGGCGCHAGAGHNLGAVLPFALLMLLVLARRRRSR
jgi:MYXO-CTERM domain-containing protein